MNAYVFWPKEPEVGVASLMIRDGDLWFGARDEDGKVLVSFTLTRDDVAGIRAVLTEYFGAEAE